MDQRDAWPFVGRAATLRDLQELQADSACGGVVLSGPAGVGKSRLAAAVLAAAGGAALGRVVATPAARTIPYAAIVHLIPGSVLEQPGPVDPMRLYQAVRAMCPDGARRVLLVDDINHLDEASLSLITQLHAADVLFLVGTARDDVELPPAVDATVRALGMRRMSLGTLTADDVAAITAEVVGHPVDAATAADLWERTAGNALYLRELLLGALTTGPGASPVPVGPGGTVHLRFDASRNARLAELVAERVRGLDPAVGATLALLAVAEPLLATDLARGGLLDHAATLERHGLVSVDPAGSGELVRLSHPVHGEVLRSSMGPLARHQHVQRAIELVSGRTTPLRGDSLRIALWQLDIGQPAEPEALVAGAFLARAAMDLPSTHRLASAANAANADASAQYLLAESLFLMGRSVEAEAIAAAALSLPDLPVTLRLLTVAVRVNNLVWGFGDVPAAQRVIAEHADALTAAGMGMAARILEANAVVYDGQPERTLVLLGKEPTDAYAMMLGALSRAGALTALGRFDEAVGAATRAYDGQMSLPDPNAFMDPNTHLLTRGVALVALGRFAEADALVAGAHATAEQQRVPFMRALHATLLGQSSMRTGRLHDARLWFTEALNAATEVNLGPLRRLALAGLAAVAGQLGDGAAAERALVELDAQPCLLRYGSADEAVGRAWCLVALGRLGEARPLLRAAVDDALTHGELTLAATVLVEAVRVGELDWDDAVLDRLATVEGRLVAAWLAFARALAGRRPEPLAAVATELADLGAMLLAAEAEVALAERLRGAGDQRGSGAASQRSAALLARCQGARTPLSTAVTAVVPLSAREREIALLAATGLASKDIAERLFLSVRTVDNHLQRVYVKLGVGSRSELAAALRTDGASP